VFNSNITLKTQSYRTHIQVFQVTSFDFVNEMSSEFFLSKAGQWKIIIAYSIEISFLYNIHHTI